MADDEEDIVKTETAKLKAKIEELQNAVSESEAAAKAAQTDSERISALLQAYELSIDLVGYTIMITDFAYPITKVKNESWLTEGRKVCLRAIIIMEELVTGFVETDFASVEEKLLPLLRIRSSGIRRGLRLSHHISSKSLNRFTQISVSQTRL